MKSISLSLGLILVSASVFSQTPQEIISRVYQAQRALKTVSYNLVRSDTLLTGDTRTMSGHAKILVDHSDSAFGLKFRAGMDGQQDEQVYDGHLNYKLDTAKRTYKVMKIPQSHILDNGGGSMVMQDLIMLDTSRVVNFKLKQVPDGYYLTMTYPDLEQYGITNRVKIVKISKENYLPVTIRSHQESLGKVQDLYYKISELVFNKNTFANDFASDDFLRQYQELLPPKQLPVRPVMSLQGTQALDFSLMSFDNKKVVLSDLKGKVILLDFWETWCSPCVESMPKVQQLFDKYKDKGLEVYGIIHETGSLESAKSLVRVRKIDFPMLLGTEQTKKDFKLKAFPTYILIDKTGKVAFISEGFSDELKEAIERAMEANN